MAELRLIRLTAMSPDARLYGCSSSASTYLRANPPGADWDGAFTFQTK